MTPMTAEATSSYRRCQLLGLWSCLVCPDHGPLTSGGKQLSDIKISTCNSALDLQGLFLGSVWREKTGLQPPLTLFLYGVPAPGWSLPLGQCATHVSSDWLTSGCSCHGKCPAEANAYASAHPSVSRQNLRAVLVEDTHRYFVHACEHVCARWMHVHTHVWQVRY